MNKIRIVNNEIIPFDSSNDLKIYNNEITFLNNGNYYIEYIDSDNITITINVLEGSTNVLFFVQIFFLKIHHQIYPK